MADEFLTYAEILARVKKVLKKEKGSIDDLINYMINMVYVNEVMVCDDINPLFWLIDFDDSLTSKSPSVVTGITQAATGVVTTDEAHGLLAGDIFSIHDVVGMTEVNDRLHTAASIPSTITINIGTSTAAYTAYTSGGVAHHKGVTLDVSGKDVDRILSVGWNTESPMVEITDKEIDNDIHYHDDDNTGTPKRYHHEKSFSSAGVETNLLKWFPGADNEYRLRYRFEKRVTRLSADADAPLLPSKFHDVIVSGTVARLIENGMMVENPSIWPSLYSSQLDAIRDYNRKYYKENDAAFRIKAFMA